MTVCVCTHSCGFRGWEVLESAARRLETQDSPWFQSESEDLRTRRADGINSNQDRRPSLNSQAKSKFSLLHLFVLLGLSMDWIRPTMGFQSPRIQMSISSLTDMPRIMFNQISGAPLGPRQVDKIDLHNTIMCTVSEWSLIMHTIPKLIVYCSCLSSVFTFEHLKMFWKWYSNEIKIFFPNKSFFELHKIGACKFFQTISDCRIVHIIWSETCCDEH